MNKLYGLLLSKYPNAVVTNPAWYIKRTTAGRTTTKIQAITDILLSDVPEERSAMFVSVVCYMVLMTQFGKEIQQLDPNNSYVPVVRKSDADNSDQAYCMHDLIKPASSYSGVRSYLDTDITDRLDSNSWLDLMGAACLQILREAK